MLEKIVIVCPIICLFVIFLYNEYINDKYYNWDSFDDTSENTFIGKDGKQYKIEFDPLNEKED